MGDSGLGGDIKAVLDKHNRNQDKFYRFGFPAVQTLLILAKRAYESSQRLVPELQKGAIVLADRDIDTVASYQALSFDANPEESRTTRLIQLIRELDAIACEPPALTFYLKVSIAEAIRRVEKRDQHVLRPGEVDFLRRATKMDRVVLVAESRYCISRLEIASEFGMRVRAWLPT
jgi:thymidylate kinase